MFTNTMRYHLGSENKVDSCKIMSYYCAICKGKYENTKKKKTKQKFRTTQKYIERARLLVTSGTNIKNCIYQFNFVINIEFVIRIYKISSTEK